MDVQAAVLSASNASVNWGDVPTWVSSVGSVLALVFAAVAVVAARRTYRIESDRDRVSEADRIEQEQRERRGQAALISAWWGWNGTGSGTLPNGDRGAFARNASEAPVYQVYFTVLDRADDAPSRKLHLPVLPPADRPQFYGVPLESPGRPDGSEPDLRVQLSFTDAAGVRWRRDKYGRLFDLEPKLEIWVHDRFAEAMSPFAEDFRSAYGIEVRFNTRPFSAHRELLLEPPEGEAGGVFIAPHDWCGELVAAGAVEHLTLTEAERSAFLPWALEALSRDGRLYGIPATLDTTVLYTNRALIPEPPASLDELIATGTALKEAGRADEVLALQVGPHGDPYHLSPLFTSAGGRLFGRRDGAWDPADVQVDLPGSVAAFERLAALGERGSRVLRRAIDEPTATRLFTTGRAPYLISSSWGAARARAAGVDFAVTPVPAFADGLPARPFVTVNGAYIPSRGRNKLIAHDFVPDYLSRSEVVGALARGLDAPVALPGIAPEHPVVPVLQAACRSGDPMPAFPWMRQVWSLLGAAQAAAISGAPAAATARKLARDIRAAL